MHPFVEAKRAQVAELCRRHGARRLDLFDSGARSDFDDARSDLDFPVDLGFDPSLSPLDSDSGLKDQLEALFVRSVDLVSRGAIGNPYGLATIQRDRQLVDA